MAPPHMASIVAAVEAAASGSDAEVEIPFR
jgi:hypothetical protein